MPDAIDVIDGQVIVPSKDDFGEWVCTWRETPHDRYCEANAVLKINTMNNGEWIDDTDAACLAHLSSWLDRREWGETHARCD